MKKVRAEIIGYKVSKVVTEQFAIIEQSFNANEIVVSSYDLGFSINRVERIIIASTTLRFLIASALFILIKVSSHYSIKEDLWASIEQDNKLKLKKAFLNLLMINNIAVARGILHSKTESTEFNKFVVPMIDVQAIIKKDLIISIEELEA